MAASDLFDSAGFICPTIPIETMRMLADTPMIEIHDDNGPGTINCPVCNASALMRWVWGKRIDSPDEINHHKFCPVAYAKRGSKK